MADKISETDKTELKEKLEVLKKSLEEGKDDVAEKTKELQDVSWRVTQQAYQQNTTQEESKESKEEK